MLDRIGIFLAASFVFHVRMSFWKSIHFRPCLAPPKVVTPGKPCCPLLVPVTVNPRFF
jgi:hypothetical protein